MGDDILEALMANVIHLFSGQYTIIYASIFAHFPRKRCWSLTCRTNWSTTMNLSANALIKYQKTLHRYSRIVFNLPDLMVDSKVRRSGDFALTDIALYETVGNRKHRYSFGRFIRSALLMLIDALCNSRLIFYPDAIERRNDVNG